jgi:hypothetical protein
MSGYCEPRVRAYVLASKPVVRVGEIVTLTGAIMNECARLVWEPYFSARTEPHGILSPAVVGVVGYYSVPIREFRELALTLLAVGTGPVTITSWMIYEALNDYDPPMYHWDFVAADPIVVRVFPNSYGALRPALADQVGPRFIT